MSATPEYTDQRTVAPPQPTGEPSSRSMRMPTIILPIVAAQRGDHPDLVGEVDGRQEQHDRE